MNVRAIAVLVAGAVAAASALLPTPAKADTAITIGNLDTKPLKFNLRCDSGGAWHLFTIGPGEYKLYFGDLWHADCDNYEASIGTNQSNGAVTTQTARMLDQHTYVFVKTQSVGYAAHDVNDMIIVVNASGRELDLNYFCANVGSKTMVIGPHNQSWLFVGNRSACSPYLGSVREEGRETATLATTALPTGNIFTLAWNDDRHMWTMRSTRAGANAPDASN